MFSCEFCEISKNTFFTEHSWTAASIKINIKFSLLLTLIFYGCFYDEKNRFCVSFAFSNIFYDTNIYLNNILPETYEAIIARVITIFVGKKAKGRT